jgi:hypothetical protein
MKRCGREPVILHEPFDLDRILTPPDESKSSNSVGCDATHVR